jgi:hypothetical protein
MIFPYIQYTLEPTAAIPNGKIGRPRIPIRNFGRNRPLRVFGLVDTGADHVFLSAALAKRLGMVLGDPAETAFAAGGHRSDVWPGFVELEVAQGSEAYRWRANIGFLAGDDDPPIAYLGQAGFLEYFTADFDGERQTVELIPNKTLPSV